MLIVDKNETLNGANLKQWISEWKKDMPRLLELKKMLLNKDNGGVRPYKMPFAKKLVITVSSAALGEGVTISAPKDISEKQLNTYNSVKKLFNKEVIIAHDRKMLKDAATYGRSYELVYFSSDEKPIPKIARYSATNAFVVRDNTVEANSLYGVCYTEYTKGGQKYVNVAVYDNTNKYECSAVAADSVDKIAFDAPIPHNIGRVPLTEFINNEEEQGDFEQVMGLIQDRTEVHNLNLKDMKAIAKNYLKARNTSFAGDTEEEKLQSSERMARLQQIELDTDGIDVNDNIEILTKQENYTSVDVFGKDIDSKIYDLSMIPDLSSEQFAGNQSGIALELKLLPFKELVGSKDEEIEKMYRRRLKMYIHALCQKSAEYEMLDSGEITININRNWSKNILEISQVITALCSTGKFSDKTIINLMPGIDYDEELEQKSVEAKNAPKDDNNSSTEWLASLMGSRYGGV